MPAVELRKQIISVEETWHEGGPVAQTPNRRASCAAAVRIIVPSGVPKVGAPDCMEMELTKVPKTTGDPGRSNWV